MIVLRTKQYSSFWQKLKGNPDLKNKLRTWDPNFVSSEVKREPLFTGFPKQMLSWLSFLYENVKSSNESYVYGFGKSVTLYSYDNIIKQLKGGRAGFGLRKDDGVIRLLNTPATDNERYYLYFHIDENYLTVDSESISLIGSLMSRGNHLGCVSWFLEPYRSGDRVVDAIKKFFINK